MFDTNAMRAFISELASFEEENPLLDMDLWVLKQGEKNLRILLKFAHEARMIGESQARHNDLPY
jgi:hypothetical protein